MKRSDLEANTVAQTKAVNAALKSYEIYKDKCPRKDIIVVINMREPSYRKRLYVYNITENIILRTHHVAHGSGSAKDSNKAYADKFSNLNESHMSSLGAMITSDTYQGKHGYSLRLDGLEKGINDNVRRRTIVFHAAEYVTDEFILKNGRAGLSWGCPAIDGTISNSLIQMIKGGVFVCVYY